MTQSSFIEHTAPDHSTSSLARKAPRPQVAGSMKFAAALLQELKRRGIRRIFGVPGRENAGILFNEVDGIDYITTRVEFTAGIMADFTGRLTRKPQVCFSTMGPGATNMATAVASAMLNHSPMIFFSAQLESDDKFYNLTHQCVDQTAVMAPICKWSYELKTPEELSSVIDKAFRIATTEPVGPVHIAIPTNFFASRVSSAVDRSTPIEHPIRWESRPLDPVALVAAHDHLMHAKQPVCLVGEGTVRVGAERALLDFCTEWNIPFVTAANAKGIVPFDHPLNYGAASPYMEGILGYPALQDMYEPVDLLLCVGYQYVDDLLPKMWAYGARKTVLSLATHPTLEIHSKFKPDVECVGGIPALLGALSAHGVQRKESRSITRVKAVYREIVETQGSASGKLSPIQVIDVVNRNLGEGILCTDIGYYRHHAILFSAPKAVGRFFTDAGLSSFGSGLPAAIAAQLERPNAPVFLVCGDGGFHSGSGDLETLARYRLPVIVIVMNNSSFELINLYQRRSNKDPNPKIVKLGSVDFVKLAEANGCRGVRANSPRELENAIRAHDRSAPLVIEVPMEYNDREGFRESF